MAERVICEGSIYEIQDGLDALRVYQNAVENGTIKRTSYIAEALFWNEQKTESVREAYYLESLLKNAKGETVHPNVMRFYLYKLQSFFAEEAENQHRKADRARADLQRYNESGGENSVVFDVEYTKKKKETSIDEMVMAEKNNPTLLDNLGGYAKLYPRLRTELSSYHDAIDEYLEALALWETYRIGLDYVRRISREFLEFFHTFDRRVRSLSRRKLEIVDGLDYDKKACMPVPG